MVIDVCAWFIVFPAMPDWARFCLAYIKLPTAMRLFSEGAALCTTGMEAAKLVVSVYERFSEQQEDPSTLAQMRSLSELSGIMDLACLC